MHLRNAFFVLTVMLIVVAQVAIFGEEPPKKVDPPDANAQAEATNLIKEVYGDQISAAKTAEQKTTLAEKIFQEAKQNVNGLSAQYVMLRLTTEIAAQASDSQTALSAIDEMDKSFRIDALDLKADILRKCAMAARTADQRSATAEKSLGVANEAMMQDNFPLAKQVLELALGEAKRSRMIHLSSSFRIAKAKSRRWSTPTYW